MTTATVVYTSRSRLECGCRKGAGVFLCVSSSLLQPALCALRATIVSECVVLDSCGIETFTYTFKYNPADLSSATPLDGKSITGTFCESCLTRWVECQIPCFADTETVSFSTDENGCVVATAVQATPPCFTDSISISWDVVEDCEVATVNISGDADNALSLHSDGLYATAGGGGGSGWLLIGNAGTVDGTNFLGTTDNVAHDIRVNNIRARRTVPEVDTPTFNGPYNAPNILDGNEDNSIAGLGSVIGGGGYYAGTDNPNEITGGHYSTIGGGGGNRIIPDGLPDHGSEVDYGGFSLIAGGADNKITWNADPSDNGAGFHVIGGGQSNTIQRAGGNAVIGGGFINRIVYPANMLTAVGGFASIDSDTISGGNICSIFGQSSGSPLAVDVLGANFIGGGETNEIHNGIRSTVAGGWNNIVNIYSSTSPFGSPDFGPVSYNGILSGADNSIILGQASFIGAGHNNLVIGDGCSSILGGFKNLILASVATPKEIQFGNYTAVVPQLSDGSLNVIAGGFGNYLGGVSGSSILGGAFLSLGDNSVGFQSSTTRDFTGYVGGDPFIHYLDSVPVSLAQVDLSAFPDIAYFGDIDLWVGNTDGTARKLKFLEPNSDLDFSSTNYSSFQAQAQSANIEYVLPASAGTGGQSLKILSVVGAVVTLQWA